MYKAIKKFYCPLSKKRVSPGELIEIPEQHLSSYAGYVEIMETAVIQPVETVTIESAVEPKPKKKKVKGNA